MYEGLKRTLNRDLNEYDGESSLNMTELETVNKLTTSLYNLCKLETMGDYSGAYNRARYSRDYGNDNSYGHYVRGHYSRDMGERFEHMMNDVNTSPQDKEILRRASEMLR